jgi:hypothetical protein
MIIWGWATREVELASGEFYCPHCAGQRAYRRVQLARYFTLYFMPLFRTGDEGQEYVKCKTCELVFKKEVLGYEPPIPGPQPANVILHPRTEAERMAYSARADLEAGMPLQMVIRKLMNAGEKHEDADTIVTRAAGRALKHCRECDFDFIQSITHCSGCGQDLNRDTGIRPAEDGSQLPGGSGY